MSPEILTVLGQAGPVGVVGGLLLWWGWSVVQTLLAEQKAQQAANREWLDKTTSDHRAEVSKIIADGRADTASLVAAHREEMGRIIDNFRDDLAGMTTAITALTSEVKSLGEEVRK